MTRNEIEERIAHIRRIAGDDEAGDDEAAHSYEDALRSDFLTAIANGKVAPIYIEELAQLVLTTAGIKFRRWYA